MLIGRWLTRSLNWLRGGTLKLLFFAGGVLLVWGILAPVGTLTWWLNQGSESLGLKLTSKRSLPSRQPSTTESVNIDCYIIYFPGVGDYSADQLTPGEELFLNRLVKLHPNCVAVPDVFPYSAANESLSGKRLFAPVWTAIEQADGWLKNADVLIKIRNLWRFAISADHRYGQVYNQGIAQAVIDRMNAAHPISQSRKPLKLVLIGTSGGAQVALGSASYLKQWLNADLIVVSVGGDFNGDAGFAAVKHVYHLRGQRDWIEDLSNVLFPSRWQWTVASPFNQARQQKRYSEQVSGPHEHDGEQGYFGLEKVGDRQKTYVELTLQQVNQLPIW